MIEIEDVQDWDDSISDKRAGKLIMALTAGIEAYLGRSVQSRSYVHQFSGTGTRYLQMKAWPITEIESVTLNKEVLDEEEYSIHGDFSDFIYLKNFPWPRIYDGYMPLSGDPVGVGKDHNIEVAYTAGYSVIPADLVVAMAREIVAFNAKNPLSPGMLIEERTPGGLHRRWRIDKENIPGAQRPFGRELLQVLDDPRFKSPKVP